jgi:hypothetical protein
MSFGVLSATAIAGSVLAGFLMTSSSAHAQDFLSGLFGSLMEAVEPAMPSNSRLGYGREPDRQFPPRQSNMSVGSSAAYCVRTCDGRYFPASGSDRASRAEACNQFCPASETKVFYGSSIDRAVTDNGKSYSELPNAYKYREALVAGCTCNGKDPAGLATIKPEDDKTLRRGDIVAGEDGLVVANKSADRRGASLSFSPASPSIRARFEVSSQETQQ